MSTVLRLLLIMLFLVYVAACGNSGSDSDTIISTSNFSPNNSLRLPDNTVVPISTEALPAPMEIDLTPRPLVELKATETAGVIRQNEWLRSGVPLAQGALVSTDRLALKDKRDGKIYPVATKVQARWPDNSIRWLLVNTQLNFQPNQQRIFELVVVEKTVTPKTVLSLIETDSSITVSNDELKIEISKNSGVVIDKLWRNNILVWQSDETSGPWIKKDSVFYRGSTLTKNSIPLPTDDILDFRKAVETNGLVGGYVLRDPWELSVEIEEQSELHAVIKVSGAHLTNSGESFSFFESRLYFSALKSEVKIDHTLTVTGDEKDSIEGYGFKVPVSCEAITAEGQVLVNAGLLHDSYDQYKLGSTVKKGQSLGLAQCRNVEDNLSENNMIESSVSAPYVILKDMAENFPKSIQAASGAIDIQLYPESLPALNLSRYSKKIDEVNGEIISLSDNRGAQGLAKTETFYIGYSSASNSIRVDDRAKAIDAAPIMLLAEPSYYSDVKVFGVGDFYFNNSLDDSESLYRIDRKLKVIEDFMRYNQRQQFNWFGMIDYGDIRGLFEGGSTFKWSELGRYGWSGNSGEPSNQLWIQFFRTLNPDVLIDAIAMSKHTMDVQMVHYGDAEVTDSTPFNGRNLSYAVGSLHRHGRQAWSGYAAEADYSHIAGVETYYYLTGDPRAKTTLFEAAQFIERYISTPLFNEEEKSNGINAGNRSAEIALVNGVDVLDRASSVFHDTPSIRRRFDARLNKMINDLVQQDDKGRNFLENSIIGKDKLSVFSEMIRALPALQYRQERLGEKSVANLILSAADVWIGNREDPWGWATSGESSGVFYIMNPLAYAHGLQKENGTVNPNLVAMLKKIFDWHTHTIDQPSSAAISLKSWENIPLDWRDWSWTFTAGTLPDNNPGILWIARQMTFRNNFMQDYHSYRAFVHLATLAAQVESL